MIKIMLRKKEWKKIKKTKKEKIGRRKEEVKTNISKEEKKE